MPEGTQKRDSVQWGISLLNPSSSPFYVRRVTVCAPDKQELREFFNRVYADYGQEFKEHLCKRVVITPHDGH